MPTAYRSRVEIRCNREICIEDKARENVRPECNGCTGAVTVLIGLNEQPIIEVKELKKEAVKAAKKK